MCYPHGAGRREDGLLLHDPKTKGAARAPLEPVVDTVLDYRCSFRSASMRSLIAVLISRGISMRWRVNVSLTRIRSPTRTSSVSGRSATCCSRVGNVFSPINCLKCTDARRTWQSLLQRLQHHAVERQRRRNQAASNQGTAPHRSPLDFRAEPPSRTWPIYLVLPPPLACSPRSAATRRRRSDGSRPTESPRKLLYPEGLWLQSRRRRGTSVPLYDLRDYRRHNPGLAQIRRFSLRGATSRGVLGRSRRCRAG